MAKTDKATKTSKGKTKQIFLVFGLLASIVFLPTTVLLLIGMLPTLAAAFVERGVRKTRSLTIAAMNFTGCMPFLMDLWTRGHTFDAAFSIVSKPMNIIIIYSGAVIGVFIYWGVTVGVSTLMYQQGVSRKKYIEKRQDELIERWGKKVMGEEARESGAES